MRSSKLFQKAGPAEFLAAGPVKAEVECLLEESSLLVVNSMGKFSMSVGPLLTGPRAGEDAVVVC